MNGDDWFARAFGAALDDIRKRTFEEPWFGRAVTPPHRTARGMADELGWEKPSSPEQPQQGHEQGWER